MKKFFLYASAVAAMLFAGSCQKEALKPASEGDVAVKISLELPKVETKAMSQAETTDIVYYEIWNSEWTKQLYPVDNQALASVPVVGKKATVELTLIADQTYNFIFWAQNENCGAYNVNELKNVGIDYSVIANPGNQDKFDAFYAVKTIKVEGAINETVTLYRPFAQLNFGTTRMASSFGPVEVGETRITVSQLADTFMTIEGIGDGETGPVTFVAENLATDTEMLKTNGQEYTWVTMDYMLMNDESDVVEVAASFDLGMDDPVEHLVANVPLKKNYRTNIVGDLFTADAVLNIIVDPDFLQSDEVITAGVAEEIVPVDGVYNVEKPGHILWLSKQSNEDASVFSGATIKFVADIDMMGQGFLPINIFERNSIKVEGQGHKVYNFSVRGDDYRDPETEKAVTEGAGLFGKVKGSIYDLHVEDVLVESNHHAGALVGYIYGNVKNSSAKNVKVVSTPYYSIKDGKFVYDEANNVGGLIGYTGEGNYVHSGNSVMGAELTAYRAIGGLVGTINKNVQVNDNTVNDVTITVDQTYKPYLEAPKTALAGEIVGRFVNSTEDVSDNNATDVVITGVYTVATTEELQWVLDECAAPNNTLIKFIANLAGDVTVKQAEGENIVIDGCGYKYDGTITVNGDARANGDETLTFTGINFETATDGITFISAPSKVAGRYNYSHNVTIEGCTFTGNHTVGSANFTGTYNLAMKDCVANNMHSALQVQSCGTAVLVDKVTVNNGKNGVSFGNTAFPTLTNSVINAAGYGVRGDGDASRGNLVIENTTITADLPVVIRKVTTDGYAVALNGGALNTTDAYHVVFTKGSDDAAFVAPEVSFSISGADNYVVFPYQHAVYTAEELQAVLDAATSDLHVVFAANLAGNVTVLQKEGVNVLLEGKGKKYDGTITVNGDARANGAETLKFTGINFETATDGITFISAPSKVAGRYNYSHNVTIENCTFTGNHTVGSANFTGTYNLAMTDCVANNMHSALQVQSCGTAVVVDNVKVNGGKNGVSFGNTAFPTLKNSVINAAGYGVRGDGNASRGNLVIENTTIAADLPVVIRKVTTDGYAVALNGGSLETISGYDVVFTKGSDDEAFVAPEVPFSISGADDYVVFPGKFAARTAAALQAILDAATSDVYVVLAADIKGNATVGQKEGVNVVIDGQKNKFDGTIYVNGNSRYNGAETLTIKNVDFESATVVDFISSNSSSDGKIRYAHNVAVEGCSFVGTAADAVAIRTRQAYNISVKNCTAELGHSFAQLTSTAGFNAEGVAVKAPRGFNLGNSNTEATFNGCAINATKADGYGIRFDNGAALNVTECQVNAYEPVVFRNCTAACQFNLASSTLTPAGAYHVVVEGGSAPAMNGVDGLAIKY